MLLRFSAANHLSLREPQELSLIASALKDSEAGLIECGAAPRGRVLPVTVIYGANASGKSNVAAALRWMRGAVLFSHSRGNPGGGVPRDPFALDSACGEAPSVFEADFVVEGVRYHYGFSANNKAFLDEYLFASPHGKRQVLFERNGSKFKFGRGLKGQNRVISALTRDNSLFLSAAAQNGHDHLSKIVNFFQRITTYSVISIHGISLSRQLKGRKIDDRVIKFLSNIGTGVVGYRTKTIEMSEDDGPIRRELAAVAERLKALYNNIDIQIDTEENVTKIELAHQGRDGENVYFDLDRESAGTRRLLALLGSAFRALDEGTLLVVDELDASLHTQACEAVVSLFTSRATNPNGAQLIATTHDTNLLRSSLLRRDEIWFTEKDAEGATHLYPLTDIRTHKGDNIEKGYLQGRFGAIPFAGRISDLVTAD